MAAPVLSFRRKLVYAAVLSAVAATVLLTGLEAGLRLVGFGYSPDFARSTKLPDGKTGWRENRWCTAPYFSPELVRRPQAFRLPEKKVPRTYRVFVLGDSAAMGDPEPSFSIGRMLGAMLHAAYPEERFEVVNAAITAINSHVERGIADDCARLEPDLFIVYAGNNEVIGPFGPAGVFAPFLRSEAAVRTAVWLKGTRTGQLFSTAGRALTGGAAGSDWGGMQMFLKQQIAADDPRLDAVRAHFRANLRAIASAAHRAGATTLLCTVLTNQRDFAPFMSQHRRDLSAEDLASWQAAFANGNAAERSGDAAAAQRAYETAWAIDDHYAELAFRLGRLELAVGRDAEAKALLQRAEDLDTLRFRADSTLNQVIRDLRADGTTLGVELVDVASDLAERSPHGIVGDELLYEHVHLTFRGAYEVASELFSRVTADLVRRGIVARAVPSPFREDEARVRLGYTTYEQTMIAIQLLARFRDPPFSGQSDQIQRVALWERRAKAGTTLLARPDALPVLREIYRQAIEAAPDDWILARNAGEMMVARQDAVDALPLLQRAAGWIDDDIDTLVALGWAQRELGHAAEADAIFARARTLEPHYPGLPSATQGAGP